MILTCSFFEIILPYLSWEDISLLDQAILGDKRPELLLAYQSKRNDFSKLKFTFNSNIGLENDKFVRWAGLRRIHYSRLSLSMWDDSGENVRTDILLYLSGLTGLKKIGLQNAVDEQLQHLPLLTSLKTLHFQDYINDEITDDGLQHLSTMTNLTDLSLHGLTAITDDGLKHLRSLKKLEILDLCGADKITNKGLEVLSTLTNLKTLEFCFAEPDETGHRDLHISDLGLQHLSTLTNLTTLYVNFNPFILNDDDNYESRFTEKGLQHLSRLTNLKDLTLLNTNIENDAFRHLAGLTKMESLNIEGSKIGDGLRFLTRMNNLKSLIIDSCPVKNEDLRHLSGLTQLTDLNLRHCDITADGLHHLSKLSLRNLKTNLASPR